MRYKALAIRLRQATGTKDPKPTSKLLVMPHHKAVVKILADETPVFARVFSTLEHMLSFNEVRLEASETQDASERLSKKRRRAKT
jgi:hypothetical protein